MQHVVLERPADVDVIRNNKTNVDNSRRRCGLMRDSDDVHVVLGRQKSRRHAVKSKTKKMWLAGINASCFKLKSINVVMPKESCKGSLKEKNERLRKNTLWKNRTKTRKTQGHSGFQTGLPRQY